MKVAIQTIIWGSRPKSISSVIKEAREAGYDGIEVFQHPSQIIDGVAIFYEQLTNAGLSLVGVTGGSIEERVAFIEDFEREQHRRKAATAFGMGILPSIPPTILRPYAYVDAMEELEYWRRSTPTIRLAIHPHVFRSIQTLHDVRKCLGRYPWLEFLPDTAHLKIAGERAVSVIEEFYARLAAVHLKDWTPEFGRSYQFYGRGFTELGCGEVEVCDVINFLKEKDYSGWLVVEKDSALSPKESAMKSRVWLKSKGI